MRPLNVAIKGLQRRCGKCIKGLIAVSPRSHVQHSGRIRGGIELYGPEGPLRVKNFPEKLSTSRYGPEKSTETLKE